MWSDQELTFSDSQAVTASAASTNYVDLGPKHSSNTYRRIADGNKPVWLVITCTVAMTDAASNSTVTPSLQTDDNTSFSSATTLQTFDAFAALSAAGTQYKYRLSPMAFERYIQVYYTVANGNLTTGSFKAQIVEDATLRTDYYSASISNAE